MIGRSTLFASILTLTAGISLVGAIASMSGNDNRRPRAAPPIEPPTPVLLAQANDRALPIADRIGAVGLVEPSSQEMQIGTHASGKVAQVFVEPGASVKRDQPLFALDSQVAEAVLAQRRGDLAAAQARLALARARVPGLRAEVEAAQTAVDATRAEQDEGIDLVRAASGLNSGATITAREITRRQNYLRTAEANHKKARARLAIARANLSLLDETEGVGASIAVELAGLHQARQAVTRAEIDLEQRTVRAPADSSVLQVNLRPGEFAQAGALEQALMVLGRTEPMHVRIDIDEADIPRYSPGAVATGSVRGRAQHRLKLNFVRVEPLVVTKRALSGQKTERSDTRILQVIYEIEPGSPAVFIGQQIDIFIESEHEPDKDRNFVSYNHLKR